MNLSPSALAQQLPGRNNPTQKFEDLLHVARLARQPFDRETWMNLAFFLGYQYVEWDDDLTSVRRMSRPKNMPHLPRPVANKIQHFVLDEQATALQDEPNIDVLPASDDPSDISIANVAKAYLDWLSGESVADLPEALSEATMWALAGTESFLKWVWDPKEKRGDVVACSPLDIYSDPWAKNFYKSRWIIHSQFMDPELVYDLYGQQVLEQSIEKADPYRVAFQREMGLGAILQGAYVNELWMKPNRRHPEGLFTVWCGHQFLVEPTGFPYEHKLMPFTQIGSIRQPGTQHYISAVSSLRKPQMELNKFHSQKIQIREAFANPKWFIATELDMEEDPNDSPRQILRGNATMAGLKPELIMPVTMPPSDDGDWIQEEMMDVAGIHEVSQGQVPGRVESAKAINELQAPDNSRLRELRRTIRKSLTLGGWMELRLAQQYGAGKIVFQAYSREGLPETQQLMTARLNPGMRIRVTMGNGLAASRQARVDQLMTMWAQGIIQDREVMAELLDLPISSVSPDNMYDIKLARNENFEMANSGHFITANSWDNHDIHRREHNNFRKSIDFKMLATEVKNYFEAHCEMHDQLQIQQLGKMLQIQSMASAVAQGAGFQQPQAPGPLAGTPGAAPIPGQQPPPQQGPTQPGNGGTMPPPPSGHVGVPNALGAQPPIDPEEVRNSPQGEARYRAIDASSLSKLR